MNLKILSWLVGLAAGTAISFIINKNSASIKKINARTGGSFIPDRKYSRHLHDDSGIHYV